MGQLVASAAGVSPHTFIGQFSFMETADDGITIFSKQARLDISRGTNVKGGLLDRYFSF